MICTSCEGEYEPDEMRWFGDTPYCEDCFYEAFTYCVRCDEPVDRDYFRYDNNDDPLCYDCYDNYEDPDAPDDPVICDNQRTEIVSLANDWLNGKRPKRFIKINQHDFFLTEIQSGLGLVDKVLYLYGLQDREEYQIKVSPNLFNRASQFITLNNWDVTIKEDIGSNRIGISKSLREKKFNEVIELLKELTTNQTPQEIAA